MKDLSDKDEQPTRKQTKQTTNENVPKKAPPVKAPKVPTIKALPVTPSSIEAPVANVVAKDPVVLKRLMEKVARNLKPWSWLQHSPPTAATLTVARNKPPLPPICRVAPRFTFVSSLSQSDEEDKENKA